MSVRAVPVSEVVASATANVSYLYIIHEDGDLDHCKIGRARHAEWRRAELQIGNRRPLVLAHVWRVPHRNGAVVLERAIHERLAGCLVRGEWFRVSPERAAAVAERVFLEFEI